MVGSALRARLGCFCGRSQSAARGLRPRQHLQELKGAMKRANDVLIDDSNTRRDGLRGRRWWIAVP